LYQYELGAVLVPSSGKEKRNKDEDNRGDETPTQTIKRHSHPIPLSHRSREI